METKFVRTFKYWLALISNNEIRDAVIKIGNTLPEYFYEKPASSGGKYHPYICREFGGLIKHTMFALNVATIMFRSLPELTEEDKDYVYGALILHDGLKYGSVNADGSVNEYTLSNHADIMADYINENFRTTVNYLPYGKLASLIRTHYGPWGGENPPQTKLQKIVFYCDYISANFHEFNNLTGKLNM